MTVERQLVTGQKFVVTFSGRLSENRGGYLFVEDRRGARVALLRSDGNSQVPMGYELDPDRFDMLADGLSGTTSTFLFPAELLAGSYVLCTANSGPPDECTSVDVTSK